MHPSTRAMAAAMLFALAAGPAVAAEPPPGRKPVGKVTFHKAPSEENAAAREKRLKRECKGRPNAGACLGFSNP